jgi:hypothetical protein
MVDRPAQSAQDGAVWEDLLRGFMNAQVVFRLIACLFIGVMFWLAGWPTHYYWDPLVCIGTIAGSAVFTWIRRTRWHRKPGEVNLGWGTKFRWELRWVRTTWRYWRFPIGPLLVDLGTIGFLSAHTGGTASGFAFLFPILAATGDFVLYDDRRHNAFLGALVGMLILSSLSGWYGLVAQYELLEVVPLHGGRVSGGRYWVVTVVQVAFAALLAHVMHVNGKAYVDSRLRNGVAT